MACPSCHVLGVVTCYRLLEADVCNLLCGSVCPLGVIAVVMVCRNLVVAWGLHIVPAELVPWTTFLVVVERQLAGRNSGFGTSGCILFFSVGKVESLIR